MKNKVDVSEKKLNESSKIFQELDKKVFGPSNERDLKKEKEKIKTSNNSLKKIIDESKELLETIKKNDKDKRYTPADESIKKLNARAEDYSKINEVLKKYYAKEAERAFKEMERLNKIINDNLDMLSEKSKIINKLIELYDLIQIYYLNKIDNNSKANEKIDNI